LIGDKAGGSAKDGCWLERVKSKAGNSPLLELSLHMSAEENEAKERLRGNEGFKRLSSD